MSKLTLPATGVSGNDYHVATDLAGIVRPRTKYEIAALLVEWVVGDVDYAHCLKHTCQ